MSRQLAELYLRGSLINKTMKNLNKEQREEVEKRLEELLSNTSLFGCRERFCNVLAKTIGGDYTDRDIALNDYMIALTRGIIYILYHKPNPEIFGSPKQITKLFKNFVYEYMKQILNENRIPQSSVSINLDGKPIDIVFNHIIHILGQNEIKFTSHQYKSKFTISFHNKIKKRIHKLLDKIINRYIKYGLEFELNMEEINCKKSKSYIDKKIIIKFNKHIKIHTANLEINSSDGEIIENYQIEYEIHNNNIKDDKLNDLQSILPSDIKEVFNVIVDTPNEFIYRFNTENPTKNQISKFLNIPQSDVSNRLDKLKTYCTYYGLG